VFRVVDLAFKRDFLAVAGSGVDHRGWKIMKIMGPGTGRDDLAGRIIL
jgi:hypothetical protein